MRQAGGADDAVDLTDLAFVKGLLSIVRGSDRVDLWLLAIVVEVVK